MSEENISTVLNESPSSIAVSKNSKGFNYDVKIYDHNDERLKTRLINILNFVEAEVKNRKEMLQK